MGVARRVVAQNGHKINSFILQVSRWNQGVGEVGGGGGGGWIKVSKFPTTGLSSIGQSGKRSPEPRERRPPLS